MTLKEEIKREPLDLKDELHSSSEDQQSSDGESPRSRRKRKANPKDTRQGPKREMQCSFCGESFKGRKALKEHKLALHPDLTGKSGVIFSVRESVSKILNRLLNFSLSFASCAVKSMRQLQAWWFTAVSTPNINGSNATNVRKPSPIAATWITTNEQSTCTSG